MKLRLNVCLKITRFSSNMGPVDSKTRSLGQIIKKPMYTNKVSFFCMNIYKTLSDCLF